MISTTLPVAQLCKNQVIALGRQMEDNYRQIIFDVSDFSETITSITLVHQRKGDVAPYIVDTVSGDQFVWTITNTDTAYYGYGQGEIRINFDNGLAKSYVFTTMVVKSITGDTVIPAPLQSWYDAMIDYIDEHAASPEQIEAAVEAYLEEHPIPAPVTSVNSHTGDVVLTASDVGALSSSTTYVSSFNGSTGAVTYTAPVTSVNTKTGAVTITAADLGAITSESDPVFAASAAYGITSADITAWNAKYTKPASGIPATDLTSTVQSRLLKTGGSTGQVLAKASGTNYDVAWTTVSGGGAVDSVNGQTGTVVLDADDVGALASNTTYVSSFNGSSGAVTYSAPVTSVNGATGAVSLSASDVGALADNTTYVSSFNGSTGAITYTAPVTSVNGSTGAVSLSIPTKTSQLQNDSGYITSAPVASVDGKTGAVTVIPTGGTTGQVLAKASNTDRDVEWVNQSGGGGGSDLYELVNTYTVTDADVSSIYWNQDSDGNALDLNACAVFFVPNAQMFPTTGGSSQTIYMRADNGSVGPNGAQYDYAISANISAAKNFFSRMELFAEGAWMIEAWMTSGNVGTANSPWIGLKLANKTKIGEVKLMIPTSNVYFNTGGIFYLYGRRN